LTDTPGAKPNGLLFILSGPSGVGKDAVMDRLREQRFPLRFAVTVTTRRPRQGETHGVDYFFVSDRECDRMIAEGEMLEWAMVHGKRYGVPRAQVREAIERGEDVLARVDVQGAATIRSKAPEAVLIFLAPPTLDALIPRLSTRATETAEELAIRMANAREEMKRLPEFDYLVVNHDGELNQAVETVKSIIVSERCRIRRRRVEI
jgi:guanylate kinase